jgi:hypothetical protein
MQFVTNRFGDIPAPLVIFGRLLPKTTLSIKSCGPVEGVAGKLPIFAISESYPSDKYVPPRPFNPLA